MIYKFETSFLTEDILVVSPLQPGVLLLEDEPKHLLSSSVEVVELSYLETFLQDFFSLGFFFLSFSFSFPLSSSIIFQMDCL